jgi:hypothetical protein
MDAVRCPIVELRQYTLRPGRRDVLIDLFERELVAFMDFFDRQVRPLLVDTGAAPLACLQTEHAENNFPALPIRRGENVFVWFARFPSPAHLSGHLHRLERSDPWRDRVLPTLSATLTSAPEQLRLAPTARSLLR